MPSNLGIVASGYLAPSSPTFVAASSASSTDMSYQTPLAINVPTGVQDGDFMVFVATCRYALVTPPAGWTQLYSHYYASYHYVYTRVASSEPASYSWTFNYRGGLYMGCVAYRSAASGVDVSSVKDYSSDTASFTGVTTTGADAVLAIVGSYQDGAASPSGYTQRVSNTRLTIAEKVQLTAGTETPGTCAGPGWGATFVCALKS